MIPQLNWLEISNLINTIRPEVEGHFVDRVIVPERDRFPGGYLKGEWLIRLTGRRKDCYLLISIFPRRSYLAWGSGKGPKASTSATRSPFDLHFSKLVKDSKLLKIEALPRERVVQLWFSQAQKGDELLGLVLSLIPAAPEAFLVQAPTEVLAPARSLSSPWKILARSRTIRDESKQIFEYLPPSGVNAPENPPCRTEYLTEPGTFLRALEKELEIEAYDQRSRIVAKNLRDSIKQAKERIRQSGVTLKEAQHEEDWQKKGDLLKSALSISQQGLDPLTYRAQDYETGAEVFIKKDPQLSLQQQVEKYYQNARRKLKRISEAQARVDRFQEALEFYTQLLDQIPTARLTAITPKDWSLLEKLERQAGILPSSQLPAGKPVKKTAHFLGKTFTSQEGMAILVGRSKDENLELTFKVARGNDLWLHVRGRPGAHAVIPIQPGKSAPLETLLDAANLVIYYSGGENWGTTEVDYTFKKYVKRIKDSTEASYTHNKTLLIQPDSSRLKRLLSQNDR